MNRVQPPARDYVPRRSGEIAASLSQAYAFIHHNTYDAEGACFVPSNVIFDAKEVTQVTYEFYERKKPILTPDSTREELSRVHSHLLPFRWPASGAALPPADTCEGFPERCREPPIPADRKL